MSAAAILTRAEQAGIKFKLLVDDQLNIKAPKGTLTNDIVDWLRQHKVDIIRELHDSKREEFEERAAIMEYEGGLSRPEAERRARAMRLAQ